MRNVFLWSAIVCTPLFIGCQSEDLNDVQDNDSQDMTMISVEMPELTTRSRVIFDDANLHLTWEKGDQLEFVSKSGQSVSASLVDGAGKYSATFKVPAQVLTPDVNAYYKAENFTVSKEGVASIDYTQEVKQSADDLTAHLKQNLFLKSETLTTSSQPGKDLKMVMLNSIFRFDIKSVPNEVQQITHVEWISNYGEPTQKLVKLNLPEGKLPASLFMCFDPTAMKLEAGKKIALKFYDNQNKSYVVSAISVQGKEYEAGSRYYASVGNAQSDANLKEWSSGDVKDGKLHVTKEDYSKKNLFQVLADAGKEKFGDIQISTAKPIVAALTDKGELSLINYAPVPASKVKVFCKIKSIGEEFFEIAEYDEIYGFSQSVMTLPLVSKAVRLQTRDGKTVEIPQQNGLKNSDCEFDVEVETLPDSFWKRIEKAAHPITIAFSQLKDGAWSPLNPTDCRRAVLMGMTMSYIFNHPDYEQHVKDWNTTGYVGKEIIDYHVIFGTTVYLPSKPFRDEVTVNGVVQVREVEPEEVLERLRKRKRVLWSNLTQGFSARGLAEINGDRLGFRTEIYEKMSRWQNLVEKDINTNNGKCNVFDTFFHEFAHNMGYMHNNEPKDHKGTMTYGGGWPTCNYVFLRDRLEKKNEMLIPLDGQWESRTGFPKDLKD